MNEREEDVISGKEAEMFRRIETFMEGRSEWREDLDLEGGVQFLASEADRFQALWDEQFHAACEMRTALGIPDGGGQVGFELKPTQEWLKANASPMVALGNENERLRRVLCSVRAHLEFWPGETDKMRRIVESAFDGSQQEETWR